MFLLDTNVISALAKRRHYAKVEGWIGRQRNGDLFISVISIGEIERGIALLRGKDRNFAAALAIWLDQIINLYGDRVLPFALAPARRWGHLSALVGHDSADLRIAATAIERGLTVVTRNVAHFKPTGVAVLNPFD